MRRIVEGKEANERNSPSKRHKEKSPSHAVSKKEQGHGYRDFSFIRQLLTMSLTICRCCGQSRATSETRPPLRPAIINFQWFRLVVLRLTTTAQLFKVLISASHMTLGRSYSAHISRSSANQGCQQLLQGGGCFAFTSSDPKWRSA